MNIIEKIFYKLIDRNFKASCRWCGSEVKRVGDFPFLSCGEIYFCEKCENLTVTYRNGLKKTSQKALIVKADECFAVLFGEVKSESAPQFYS